MGRKLPPGLFLLLLLALPLAWCSSGKDPPDHRIATSAPAPIISPATAPAPSSPPLRSHVAASSPPPDIDPAPVATARTAEPPEPILEALYVTAKVNIRSIPNTSGPVIGSLSAGASVEAGESQGSWRRVWLNGQEGWVASRYLSAQPPPVTAPVREPNRMVARLAAEPEEDDDDSGGVTPIREPYVGTCDCPYDVMRNGRSCGGRSAYSRPGGRKPKCYR